jgi:hypothetical protein
MALPLAGCGSDAEGTGGMGSGKITTLWEKTVKGPLMAGSSQLAVAPGAKRVAAAVNLHPAHPYYLLVDAEQTDQSEEPHNTLWHHGFDQRAFFDGSSFVIMENRDHDVGVTLMKIDASEPSPKGKFAWDDRIRSVYATAQYGNSTRVQLGQIQSGMAGGYLVAFAAERAWDFKFGSNDNLVYGQDGGPAWPPGVAAPYDYGFVHVVADFETKEPNWRNADGTWLSQSPAMVDNSQLVNSAGETSTVSYATAFDGFDWPNYTGTEDLEKLAEQQFGDPSRWNDTVRKHRMTGVNWVTRYGDAYVNKNGEFAARVGSIIDNTVIRPKLARIGDGRYIAIWEEERVEINGQNDGKNYYEVHSYQRTRAASISLAQGGDKVVPTVGAPVTLFQDDSAGRLSLHVDSFSLHGAAAWLTGNAVDRKLVIHTVSDKLVYARKEVAIPDASAGTVPFEEGVAQLVLLGDHQGAEQCPQLIGLPNPDGTLYVVWQNIYDNEDAPAQPQIFVHRIAADLGKATLVASIDSLGLLAGATKNDENGDIYIATAGRHTLEDQDKPMRIVVLDL